MESNRDESERCQEIGARKLKDGDINGALKFYTKANKLFPSKPAQDLINRLEKLSSPNGDEPQANGHSKPSSTSNEPDGPYRRPSSSTTQPPPPTPPSSSSTSPSGDYTPEQAGAVKKIKQCKNFYEILGLTKEAPDVDIKKAYKKLALQFHPDKNHAPGAADAFKMIGNAFAILSDPEKRRQYDLYGAEDSGRVSSPRSGFRTEYNYNRGFEAEISPEDLFHMFFGGATPYTMHESRARRTQFARTNQGHQQQQHHQQHEGSGLGVILQMMPVIILICLSIMSSLFVSEPAYSLVRNNKYMVERRTTRLEVPYFVKDSFEKDFKTNNLRRIEDQVEEDYIHNLRSQCFREKNYRESMIHRARHYRDITMEEKAKSIPTPACSKLYKFHEGELVY